MPCGDIQYLEGGVLKDGTFVSPNITNAKISDSVVSASTVDGAYITNLVNIDAASADVIADALARLPPESIRNLAMALLSIAPQVAEAAPTASEAPSIPTTMIGARHTSLGAPAVWGVINGYKVPMYR